MPSRNHGITILHQPKSLFTVTSKTDRTSENGDIPDHEADFDLVAIHGLNGHPMYTWTHEESEVLWLRDLLPEVFPKARIMTFGYNSRFKNFTARQSLRDISSNLLTGLSVLRRSEEQKSRPIILICHSLGGIVAKKAMLIGCTDELELVQRSVYGIMFLGTPHKGSSLATAGRLLASIVSAVTPIKPPRTLLGILRINSDVLVDIAQDFVKRRKTLHLVSFYEMEMTRIWPFLYRQIVEQHSAILNLPEETTIGQNSDHRGIARFRSQDDDNFQLVLESLKTLVNVVEEESHRNPVKSFELSSVPQGKFTPKLHV